MYKTISPEEADALWACGVKDLQYKFSGVTIHGELVEWAPFNLFGYLGERPSAVDFATGWRVKSE
jgi:hypothetical protein